MVPVQVKFAPPLSFSEPALGAVQAQPPPGLVVGPPVMTVCAAAGALPIASSPSTVSVATRTTAEPWRRRRTGIAVPRTARVCEFPPCG